MAKVRHLDAEKIFREEAKLAEIGGVDQAWTERVKTLSDLCEKARVRTHIAFLGAALIAKSTDPTISLKWIKPKHAADEASETGDNSSFSIRPLSETVLVPVAAELGIHIGVTGAQPLNNQPYFRMRYLGDGTPISSKGQAPFDYMMQLIGELQALDADKSRQALRAFVAVRKTYQPRYAASQSIASVSPFSFPKIIDQFVNENSEGGKRAQACTAGVFDALYGSELVVSGRINDPSRNFPGDVNVLGTTGLVIRAVEVKDKPVSANDVHIFVQKCLDMKVLACSYVMVARAQEHLNASQLKIWAKDFGVSLSIYPDWATLIDGAFCWSAEPLSETVSKMVHSIRTRLIKIEAPPASVVRWEKLSSGA